MIKCLKILMYTCIVAQMDVSGVKYITFCLTYWNCNVLVQGGTKVVTFCMCVCVGGWGGGGGDRNWKKKKCFKLKVGIEVFIGCVGCVLFCFLFCFAFYTSWSLAGKSGHLTWVRHSSRKSSATHSYWCVQYFCVQTMVRLPVLGIFNVRTDVDACDCTRRLYRHCKRVCTGSWLREKSLATPGTRQHYTWPVLQWQYYSWTLYQLS